MKITKEIKTAILVLSGITLFIYLFSFLNGENIFSDKNTYYTEFDFNGLTSSSQITINGNNVGKVDNVWYDFESGKTKVSFTVNPKLKINKDSKVRLESSGFMNANRLAIILGESNDYFTSGDFITSTVKQDLMSSLESSLPKVSDKLDGTLSSTEELVKNLNLLLTDTSDKGLNSAIAKLNNTLASFNNTSNSVNSLLKNNSEKISTTLDQFKSLSEELSGLTKDFKDAEIGKTISNLNTLVLNFNTLTEKLNKGEGTVGKLLNDDTLHKNLEKITEEMHLLILDIKLHPARYRRILSKKEIPYQAPKEDN